MFMDHLALWFGFTVMACGGAMLVCGLLYGVINYGYRLFCTSKDLFRAIVWLQREKEEKEDAKRGARGPLAFEP